jgi:branched-chain amino acid transport system ATP-binding protein
MLKINKINTGYNKKQVLFDLSMNVSPGKIVAIIGPNGAGKSTALKALCGLLPAWQGEILFKDKNITGKSPADIISGGITFAPQGNRVFDELTVMENLEIGGYLLKKKQFNNRLSVVLDIFPLLKEKLKKNAGTLSGGEQQILALGRALVPEPDLLLLDEPSLGLAPNLLSDLFMKLKEINKEHACAMLIVEQKVMDILEIADKVYSVKLGKVAFEGEPSELQNNQEKLKELFL